MIAIKRDAEKIKVVINLPVIGYDITFNHSRNTELDAILLQEKIQETLNKRIEEIRRISYELGWKDKASKKERKKTYFGAAMTSNYIG